MSIEQKSILEHNDSEKEYVKTKSKSGSGNNIVPISKAAEGSFG